MAGLVPAIHVWLENFADTRHKAGMTQNGEDPAGEARRLRSYGRRKGKRLSPRKTRLLAELLPQLRLDLEHPAPEDMGVLFPISMRDVWLEIGFGSGEHLLWQAEQNPDVGFIGCEPFVNGVATLLGSIEDRQMKTIRVHNGDARDILAWLPDESIARTFILFPDPWPKKRQLKRRLLTPETVAALARVMTRGGELRFASDHADYAAQVADAVEENDAFDRLSEKPDDWPETRYEQKALSAGRKPVYLRWQRR